MREIMSRQCRGAAVAHTHTTPHPSARPSHRDFAAEAAATADMEGDRAEAGPGAAAAAPPGADVGAAGSTTGCGAEAGGEGRSGSSWGPEGADAVVDGAGVYTSTMQYRLPKGCMTTGGAEGSTSWCQQTRQWAAMVTD